MGSICLTVALAGGCMPQASPDAMMPPAPGPPRTAEALVVVTRTGGFAGRTTSLEVREDGAWSRRDGESRPTGDGTLSAPQLTSLRAALSAADFPHLPKEPTGGPKIYDGFTYAFTHAGVRVVTDDGSIPMRLTKVLDALPPFGS